MPRLLLVYHTQTGGTAALSERAAKGVASIADIELVIKRAGDACAADVIAADGLLLGTPENFGYMAGMLKDFFDRIYYDCENKVAGRPYSVFVCAGNDGTGAMREIDRIVTGLRMKKPLRGTQRYSRLPPKMGVSIGPSRLKVLSSVSVYC